MQENGLNKVWTYSQLNTAISSLTYGSGCLYYDRTQNKLLPCILSIHEEYINILHVIVENEFSILFQLQEVKNISDKDLFIKQRLKSLNYDHFMIVYTSTLDNHVIVMPSENQINVLWEGLQYFVYQAIQFYSRISLMDPFKAETTMVFMDADSDGSKLLDIDEVLTVFKKLRINKTKAQIEEGISEINSDLYQKQNLKKPKDFTLNKLTPLGFQYLLQFYSLKSSLAPLFTQFCPLFKFKHKQYKKSIVDILKNQEKPLMSAGQFQQFLEKYILISKTEAECSEIIKSFPVYDGEGQQIPQQVEYLSFHSFCNFVYSSNNSITNSLRTDIYQDMGLPLNEYFIYSSNFSKLNLKSSSNLLQMYQLSIKKGCRCLSVNVQEDKQAIVVKNVMNKQGTPLSDVLKTIKNLAFSFNSYPVIISIEANISTSAAQKTAAIIKKQIGQNLYFPAHKNKHQHEMLPSPKELKNKFLLQLIGSNKKSKDEQNELTKIVTLMPTKLDFERKGLTSWDSCHIPVKDLLKYQELQNKNLTDYSRKAIVRTESQQLILQLDNYDPMPMFRNGIQLIAHNVQRQDQNQYLIHSKFYENGGRSCGYLLKPHWMRSDCRQSLYSTNFLKLQFIIKIKIFAGQKYVLKENTKGGKFKLEVKIKGIKLEQQKNKKYQSEAKNQGFYTDFDMDCQFNVYCSELSSILFSILDGDQIVSARAIPVNIMRLGLKTIELFGPGMELNLNSCLLVYVQKAEEKNKRKKAELLS